MTQEEYLTERLENQINWYNENSIFNKKCYQTLKTIEIILAAITPFVVAFVNNETNSLKIVAGLMSIVIGIIASFLIAFKFQDKWIQYRTTCENLRHEKYLYTTNSGIYTNNTNFNVFVERIEFLISKENSDWTQIVISNELTTKNEKMKTPN
jgi:hypothetical protein